jgi:hypothetical protein
MTPAGVIWLTNSEAKPAGKKLVTGVTIEVLVPGVLWFASPRRDLGDHDAHQAVLAALRKRARPTSLGPNPSARKIIASRMLAVMTDHPAVISAP